MHFFQSYRRLLPLCFLTLASTSMEMFSGCQTGSSDPNPLVIDPLDSSPHGPKDSVKADPSDRASLTLLSPVGGQTYRLGDSLRVTAAVEGNDRGTINAVEVFLS